MITVSKFGIYFHNLNLLASPLRTLKVLHIDSQKKSQKCALYLKLGTEVNDISLTRNGKSVKQVILSSDPFQNIACVL